MTGLVAATTGFIAANPALVCLVAFLVAAAESFIVIGALVPGTPILLAIGAAGSLGHVSLAGVVVAAILGAILGDGLSYWIGYRHRRRLRRGWPFKTRPGLLIRGQAFIRRFGVPSVALARFLPGVRAVVPVVAGMFGMRPMVFYVSNIASALLWAPVHILPGTLVGLIARLHLSNELVDWAIPATAGLGLLVWGLRRLWLRHTLAKAAERGRPTCEEPT